MAKGNKYKKWLVKHKNRVNERGTPTLVHGAMCYKCQTCGKSWRMWLEKGLEDKKADEVDPNSHKPVPFTIGCECGGMANHVLWGADIHLDEYIPLEDGMRYFKNSSDSDCGIPVPSYPYRLGGRYA